LLLEHARKDVSVPCKMDQEIQGSRFPSNVLDSTALAPEFSVKNLNTKPLDTASNERLVPSHISANPSSPCSVMDVGITFDKDVSTIWLDVERWNPPKDHCNGLSVLEYRNLLAHVILQSLQIHGSAPSPLRYFQGFHVLAGLVLSTFLRNASNDLTTLSLATVDAIHFLQQWICNAPLLNDVVREDTIEPILQRIRTSVLPLYYHYRSIESPNKTNGDLYDFPNDDEHNSLLVAQCLPWLLTLFCPHHTFKYDDKATNLLQCTHARIVDAVLASHPIYFPIYLCVTLLLSKKSNAWNTPPKIASSSDIEFVIQKTVDRMKYIPPQFLPQISARYYLPVDSLSLYSVLSNEPQSTAIPKTTPFRAFALVSCTSSQFMLQQCSASKPLIIQWINIFLWTTFGFVFQCLDDFLALVSRISQVIIPLTNFLHWNYLSFRYPSATVAMALWINHRDIALVYRTFKRTLLSIPRKARLSKFVSSLLAPIRKSIKTYFYGTPRN
jgi:hypothetical protein